MPKKQDLSDMIAAAVGATAGGVVGVGHGCARESGVVIDERAIIASARFVNGHDAMRVFDHDGTAHDARVLGRDPSTDIALLETTDPVGKPLTIDDSDGVRVGHLAVALGRPGRTVRASLRMVGALADEVELRHGGKLERYLETDRGLPHGFAGGPLIDTNGRVLGMNTRAVVRGADLAVTKATIARVVGELRDHGGVARGFLGVAAYPVRLPKKLQQELSRQRGALVVSVKEGSAADNAGIIEGDILLSVADQVVDGPRALRRALYAVGGTEVAVSIARGGATQAITVKVDVQR